MSQAIQLFSMTTLHDLRVTVCVCSEGSALFQIASEIFGQATPYILIPIFPHVIYSVMGKNYDIVAKGYSEISARCLLGPGTMFFLPGL